MNLLLFDMYIQTYALISERQGDSIVSCREGVAVFETSHPENKAVYTYLPSWSKSLSEFAGVTVLAIHVRYHDEDHYEFLLQDRNKNFTGFQLDFESTSSLSITFGCLLSHGWRISHFNEKETERYQNLKKVEEWITSYLPEEKPFRLPFLTGFLSFSKDY